MTDMQHLRETAEDRVRQRSKNTWEMSSVEVTRLVYELEVHREELEIQNEELRNAHRELQESRDRYANLYEFAPVGYMTMNAQGEIAQANMTACQLLGHERSRLIGKSLALLCDVDSRAAFRSHLDKVLTTGERCSAELRLSTENELFVHLETSRSFDSDQSSYACRTVITDVTARTLAQRIALERDRHLRALAEALPVLISYLDTELRYLFTNRIHHDWFGHTSEELQGRKMCEVLRDHVNRDISDYLADALRGQAVSFECELRHQKLGARHVEFMLVPDWGANSRVVGVHTVGLDVTERKFVDQLNARRQTTAVKLERLNADERKVYELLIRGSANKAIAYELGIGLRTAERRRQAVLEKLEVESLAELVQDLADIQSLRGPAPS